MFKDSGQLALEWEAANFDRAMQLNDMLDACADLHAKRQLFATFTKDEQNGLIPEYTRRTEDRSVPVGSLVKPSHPKAGIHFVHYPHVGSELHGSHLGLAVIIGQPAHGAVTRYVMLLPHWENKEGTRVYFAEAYTTDMELVK